ncbi:GNAT family N-acetyltransferase [Colwellia sp. 75C3]|uniref:GNAT family N-acetyltransferase n=1 Tax=Colwellia sp. 75C3 TaxID=888425 RepID=UPI000C32EE93|nr:GNAT family N-acetyltransferase [Colwellia sp. 75C3]PKG81389.1 GNAT family N-acetyltransferase [Colwellia sp. 75C3]
MIKIKTIEALSELTALKSAYFNSSIVPLDGMWHFGFVPMAKHFGFYVDQSLVGFCCVNDEGYLLEYYVESNYQKFSQELFTLISQQNSSIIGEVKGAFVSTSEPSYLALCLDNSTTFKVNALMYQHRPKLLDDKIESIDMQLACAEQLSEFVTFSVTNIGAPEQWLTQYYGNLITRKELFGYWHEGQLLAAGECRLFDQYQTEYADLGMIVAQTVRGQGLAKKVLTYLINKATNQGLKAICSTESCNIAAQKAISHAGFSSAHRIVQFEFSQD